MITVERANKLIDHVAGDCCKIRSGKAKEGHPSISLSRTEYDAAGWIIKKTAITTVRKS